MPTPPESLDRLRTWRGWWLAWPKWFRLGAWAGCGAVLLHAALAVRMWIGWQEPAAIRDLRESANVIYFWERNQEPVPHMHTVLSGFYGRSKANVSEVHFWRGMYPAPTNADLAYVATHFSNVKVISANGSEITAEGLKSLQKCRQLVCLELADTDLDDAGVEALRGFPQLEEVNLSGTLITPAAIPLLESLPRLNRIRAAWTPVSAWSLSDWPRKKGHKVEAGLTWREHPHVIPTVRWADGQVCERVPIGDMQLIYYFRSENGDEAQVSDNVSLFSQGRSGLCASLNHELAPHDLFGVQYAGVLQHRPRNKPHRVMLKVEDLESQPIEIDPARLNRFEPLPIEFHMPITRDEVLRKVAVRILAEQAGE